MTLLSVGRFTEHTAANLGSGFRLRRHMATKVVKSGFYAIRIPNSLTSRSRLSPILFADEGIEEEFGTNIAFVVLIRRFCLFVEQFLSSTQRRLSGGGSGNSPPPRSRWFQLKFTAIWFCVGSPTAEVPHRPVCSVRLIATGRGISLLRSHFNAALI